MLAHLKIRKYRNKKNGTQKKFGQDNESVESDSEDEEEVGGRRWNPYTEFLENIEDEGSEEEVNLENLLEFPILRAPVPAQGPGLAGGLKSWLGFAGSMTGTAALSSGPEKRVKPTR